MPENIRSMSAHRGLAIFYGLLALTFVVIFSGAPKIDMTVIGPTLLVLIICVIHSAIALGASRAAPWARISSIVVACLMLLAVPIGTLIGIYLLSNLKWPKAGDA